MLIIGHKTEKNNQPIICVKKTRHSITASKKLLKKQVQICKYKRIMNTILLPKEIK